MVLTHFEQDVLAGFSLNEKKLSSRYFYDELGDRLFQLIMNLEEYYLSRAEHDIFKTQQQRILELMNPREDFRIIELGAGDGVKTATLLKYFTEQEITFSYCPVDISSSVLDTLVSNLTAAIKGLTIEPLQGDYFRVLEELKFREHQHNVVYFLGSNIGNFSNDSAISFLSSIRSHLHAGDRMMIGFDLKKDPARILAAYNDKEGITKAFNLNILTRINKEMDADFNLETFSHNPVYDPMTGECRSYLVSTKAQDVHIGSLEETFHFDKWETIFVEVSKKYDLNEIQNLANSSGFKVVDNLLDSDGLFAESVWEVE